jgi:hypothetical protein
MAVIDLEGCGPECVSQPVTEDGYLDHLLAASFTPALRDGADLES